LAYKYEDGEIDVQLKTYMQKQNVVVTQNTHTNLKSLGVRLKELGLPVVTESHIRDISSRSIKRSNSKKKMQILICLC
jgi:hypothetical protein